MTGKVFDNSVSPQWCPGCPNFGILSAYKKALTAMNKKPRDVCVVSGIGQAAKLPHYLQCHFFNGLHGRALPAAQGIVAANPQLTVLVATGDGDCYGEGGNHFIHAVRRNPDLTVIVHNNQLYALTKGQASPTTPLGKKMNLPQRGVEASPLNMLGIAVINGCGFVARGFAGAIDHLAGLIKGGVEHKGLAVIEVIQPCITWGDKPVKWYRDRVDVLENHDVENREKALELTLSGERIPVGILYREPEKPVFGEKFRKTIFSGPLFSMPLDVAETTQKALNAFRG